MSLDIYLSGEPEQAQCVCECCQHRHTRIKTEEIFSTNITHNLGAMADEAGIYHAIWSPEECGMSKASQIAPLLKTGLAFMETDPARFKKFDAKNGWGTYDQFMPWLKEYLEACEANPNANIKVSR